MSYISIAEILNAVMEKNPKLRFILQAPTYTETSAKGK